MGGESREGQAVAEAHAHTAARPPAQIADVETVLLGDLHARVAAARERGLRFVTATCLDGGESYEIYYHFADGDGLTHLRLVVAKGVEVPSISGVYFAAFLVENEIKELFGVPISGLAIDYKGRLLLTDGGPVAPMLKTKPGTED
jgi:NADH:ubiquinone oxidoreductase subunit C